MNTLRHQSAFTLVELLLSVTILGLVLTITYSSLTSIINMKNILEQRREVRQEANAILIRIAREMQIANTSSPVLPPCNNTSNIPPGNLFMEGQSSQGGTNQRHDQIRYVAFNAGQYVPNETLNSRLVQIRYLLIETPPEYRRGDEQTWSLVREETPRISDYPQACQQAVRFPLSYNVTRLQFDYYDHNNQQWLNQWGDRPETRGLPDIVRITVGFLTRSGKEEVFTTSVALSEG